LHIVQRDDELVRLFDPAGDSTDTAVRNPGVYEREFEVFVVLID
jgi:hypothetical protein